MWQDALAAHQAGRVRVTEVRAADFLGAGAYSPFTLMVGAQVLTGAPVSCPGDLDAPHSWSYTGDTARSSSPPRGTRRPGDGPGTCPPPASSWCAGSPGDWPKPPRRPPHLERMSLHELAAIGRTDSIMAELPEMLYLYDRPNVLDASPTVEILGVVATPVDDVLTEMAAAARNVQTAR